MPNAADITIDKLHINANKIDAQLIAQDLEYSTWPIAETQEWVFVRQLKTKASKSDLRFNVSQSLSSQINRAVDGSLASASSDAVRFNTLPELLSFLLTDIISGSASGRWYWHRWSYLFRETRPNAVARVLWENIEYLPAVVACLISRNLLENVWIALSEEGSETVYRKILTLFSSSTSRDVETLSRERELAIDIRSQKIEKILKRQTSLLFSWSKIISVSSPISSRIKLAAASIGMSQFATFFSEFPDRFTQVFMRSAGISHGKIGRFDTAISELEAPGPSSERLSSRDVNLLNTGQKTSNNIEYIEAKTHVDNMAPPTSQSKAVEGEALKQQIIYEENKVYKSSVQLLNTSQDKDKSSLGLHENLTIQENTPLAHRPNPSTDKNAEMALFGDRFYTEFGGFFYLINAVRMANLFSEIQCNDDGESRSHWLGIYALAKCFGVELDDSLIKFIAIQENMDDIADLDAFKEYPDLYCYSAFEKLATIFPKCWKKSLLEVRACVIYTASHIDCFFPMNSINVPTRTAGLDVNPGWVPELGKVIAFHYRESAL